MQIEEVPDISELLAEIEQARAEIYKQALQLKNRSLSQERVFDIADKIITLTKPT